MIGAAGAIVSIALAVQIGAQNKEFSAEVARCNAEIAASERKAEQEFRAIELADATKLKAEEQAHRARLGDAALLSGERARARHEDEWRRRLAHSPELAATEMEKALLRMRQIGTDPSLAAQYALEQVAFIASPPGSRIEVVPSNGRFAVRVAFKMSAMSKNEEGAVTKHHSVATMRREVQDLSARLIRDLYDSCGARGIERLSVSCNHALRRANIPKGATDSERRQLLGRAEVVMACLYRTSIDFPNAMRVADWRSAPLSKIVDLMSIEHDGLQTLTISGVSFTGQTDPRMPLEF